MDMACTGRRMWTVPIFNAQPSSKTHRSERKQLEIEQEAWRTINALFQDKERELRKKIDEKDKALEEKDKVLEKNAKVLEENAKVLEAKEKENALLLRELEGLKRKLNEK